MAADARQAYNALSKYFGLRARDAFLNPLEKSTISTDKKDTGSQTAMAALLDELYSDDQKYAGVETLGANDFLEGDRKSVCVLSNSNNATKLKKLTALEYDRAKEDDQGWGFAKGKFDLKTILPEANANNNISVFQVFPVKMGLDVGDADIASLFLNATRTLDISRAVPYLEVRTITTVDYADGNIGIPNMSLGKFLFSRGNEAELTARFDHPLNDLELNTVSEDQQKSLTGMVAGMEIFTTPQTLVDAEHPGYTRFGGHNRIDAFRPLMGIQDLTVADTPSGAGTISYKTATLNLKLFDKGRLSEVAEFVSPRRDPSLRLELVYGWSHPEGNNISRPSDAELSPRYGDLIDSMRVSELYTVYNSSYTVNDDGTVDIQLSLTMVGSSDMDTTRLDSMSLLPTDTVAGVKVTDLMADLDSIRKTFYEVLGGNATGLTVPQFIQSPSVDSLISMNAKEWKKLKEFINLVKKKKTSTAVRDAAYSIAGILLSQGKTPSKREKLRAVRTGAATAFVESLRMTPDPFLRISSTGAGAGSFGSEKLKRNKEPKGTKRQAYASYGKIMMAALAPALSNNTNEVQFVFGSFNQDAASVFDHNISQFPIWLEDFESQLSEQLLKQTQMTSTQFVKFMNDKFLTWEGARAFGLSDVLAQNSRGKGGGATGKNEATKKLIKKANNDAGSAIHLQEKTHAMLDKIYGKDKRTSPRFEKPRVNIRITTRKTKSTADNDDIAVVRVHFSDITSGRFGSSADALMNMVKKSYFVKNDYSTSSLSRSPDHNAIYTDVLKELGPDGKKMIRELTEEEVKKITTSAEKAVVAAGKKAHKNFKKKMEDFFKNIYILDQSTGSTQGIRKFFFENAPYIAHGIEGSGLLEATLASETNDSLSAIAISTRFAKGGSKKGSTDGSLDLPLQVHPASLSAKTLGCPNLRLFQKYFIDFGTNTTLDNYYVVTSVQHSLAPGNFSTDLNLRPYDVYGRFANIRSSALDLLASTLAAIIGVRAKHGVATSGICSDETLDEINRKAAAARKLALQKTATQ